jgi:hypothetical protein
LPNAALVAFAVLRLLSRKCKNSTDEFLCSAAYFLRALDSDRRRRQNRPQGGRFWSLRRSLASARARPSDKSKQVQVQMFRSTRHAGPAHAACRPRLVGPHSMQGRKTDVPGPAASWVWGGCRGCDSAATAAFSGVAIADYAAAVVDTAAAVAHLTF